jgi:hypothetical protein
LHGRELAGRRINAFYGHYVLAVGIAQRCEAAGHALVGHRLAIGTQLAYQHGARTAIAFAAANLGASQVLMVAHKVEQCAGLRLTGANGLVVEIKLNHLRKFS